MAFVRLGNPHRIYRKSVDGGDELLVWEGSELRYPDSWSPDGRLIAYHGNGRTIGVVPLTGDAKPMVWLDTPFAKDEPHLSPNGRWMAYQSNEAGQTDVYGRGVSWSRPEGPHFDERRRRAAMAGRRP